MRTAMLSDIHANLEALTAVLDRLKSLKVDDIVCLGDTVGYNANPNEVLDILRKEKVQCIIGNHDACAAGLEEPDDFNPLARAAVLWTREKLTGENRQFLAGSPIPAWAAPPATWASLSAMWMRMACSMFSNCTG